ncbi:hypothetical protein Barb4_00983 [Bacteroidales bacterium Barb4]|nr:hypothetical protein Barb4_00983 [Bacteroidales bacterium Barb4]
MHGNACCRRAVRFAYRTADAVGRSCNFLKYHLIDCYIGTGNFHFLNRSCFIAVERCHNLVTSCANACNDIFPVCIGRRLSGIAAVGNFHQHDRSTRRRTAVRFDYRTAQAVSLRHFFRQFVAAARGNNR